MTAITVADLLASEVLSDAVLVGGAADCDSRVRDVVVVVDGSELDAVPPGICAVLEISNGGFTQRRHIAEMVCRRLHAKGGRMLVIAGPAEPPALSTARLADRLHIPLVAVPTSACTQVTAAGAPPKVASVPALTTALLALVHQPTIKAATTITQVTRALRRTDGDLRRIIGVVDKVLRGRTGLLSDGGAVLAGPALEAGVPGGPMMPRIERPTPTQGSTTASVRALHPVRTFDGAFGAWLHCTARGVGPGWDRTALQVLELAAPHAVAWLATERLTVERDARRRSALLAEILHVGEAVPDYLAEYAAKAGWRLDGWHTGIHFSTQDLVATAATPAVAAALCTALASHEVPATLDELPGGWSAWWTTSELPGSVANREIANKVRAALADYHHSARSLPVLVAGIGGAVAGPAGIAATLAQARQAAVAAACSRVPGAVEHLDELGAKRQLVGWYGSPAFQDYADQLLGPMLAAGGNELLETVETYLDCGASPHSAARRLRLHRNTVTQRIRKAEQLLGVPLAQPDERLAVHLACRAVRLRDLA